MNKVQANSEPKVFISYRREDSKGTSVRLYNDLEYALGTGKVFMDVSSVVPGSRWPDELRSKLQGARVVLVIIGRDWLKVQDPTSFQRRLDADDDWVRLEIEDALSHGKTVIPVLVRDASPPIALQLPASIRELANNQAIVISSDSWKADVAQLLEALSSFDILPVRGVEERPVPSEPSMLGVLDYFYRRINQAASKTHDNRCSAPQSVTCEGMSDLWQLIEDCKFQRQPINKTPPVIIQGQLSPYAPLLFGNPHYKRQLHLELRQGAVQLINDLGLEFGELLNGLLSYSAGQMVIRPYFRQQYVFLGLYESIVRNSIPVMIDRDYYEQTLALLFRKLNTLEVRVRGFLGEIPNYTREALDDFGITERLRTVLSERTIRQGKETNYALFVNGDENTYIDVPKRSAGRALVSRYLDGDVWVANATSSLITRFIDISSREDMQNAVNEINRELSASPHGRSVVSSFDVRLAAVEDRLPDRVLTSDQL